MFGSGPAERKVREGAEGADKNDESVHFCANKAYTHLEPCEVRMSAMWHAREKIVRDARV